VIDRVPVCAPPEELDEVDWAGLEHAYGPADDVPEMIRALYAEAAPETEDGESVGEELVNNLNHQRSLYPATLEAVPFLAHPALHVVWHRGALLEVLTRLDERGAPAAESLSGRVRVAVLAELPLLMVGGLTDSAVASILDGSQQSGHFGPDGPSHHQSVRASA
jgi:hypothetical protein